MTKTTWDLQNKFNKELEILKQIQSEMKTELNISITLSERLSLTADGSRCREPEANTRQSYGTPQEGGMKDDGSQVDGEYNENKAHRIGLAELIETVAAITGPAWVCTRSSTYKQLFSLAFLWDS